MYSRFFLKINAGFKCMVRNKAVHLMMNMLLGLYSIYNNIILKWRWRQKWHAIKQEAEVRHEMSMILQLLETFCFYFKNMRWNDL